MLNEFWSPVVERCGVILKDGSVQELNNIHPKPDSFFEMDMKQVENLIDDVEVFWHSHTTNNVNLSLADYFSFLKYPDHIHRIYSATGFAQYIVRNGLVIREL